MVWLTIGRGERSLKAGYQKATRLQSISVDEIREELQKYIDEAVGVENIDLRTFKTRLRIIDPDDEVHGEVGEQVVNLGAVTDRLATKIFRAKVEETVKKTLRTVIKKTDHDILRSHTVVEEARRVKQARKSLVATESLGLDNVVNEVVSKRSRKVVENLVRNEGENTSQRIRMQLSQRIAPSGPFVWGLYKLGLLECAQANGWFPDWYKYDAKKRERTWISIIFQDPAGYAGLRNLM